MNNKSIWLLGAVSASAMVASTACIIVDDTSGTGGAGGAGGASSSANVSTDDSTTASTDASSGANVSTGTGPCVSCSEYYSNGMGELCPASQTLAEALDSCVCGACEADCGAMCDSTATACDDCIQAAALDTCKAQNTACSNDT